MSAVLGKTLSPGDSHHIKYNTMDFKCLPRSIDGGKKVLGLGTIFQIAAVLGKVFPSQIKRYIPLASVHILLEAVSSQALYNIIINQYASENICQNENNKIEQKYITLLNGNINNMIQSDELEQKCKNICEYYSVDLNNTQCILT